jgi:hypothetical protein
MVKMVATRTTVVLESSDEEKDMKFAGCIWGLEIMKSTLDCKVFFVIFARTDDL